MDLTRKVCYRIRTFSDINSSNCHLFCHFKKNSTLGQTNDNSSRIKCVLPTIHLGVHSIQLWSRSGCSTTDVQSNNINWGRLPSPLTMCVNGKELSLSVPWHCVKDGASWLKPLPHTFGCRKANTWSVWWRALWQVRGTGDSPAGHLWCGREDQVLLRFHL